MYTLSCPRFPAAILIIFWSTVLQQDRLLEVLLKSLYALFHSCTVLNNVEQSILCRSWHVPLSEYSVTHLQVFVPARASCLARSLLLRMPISPVSLSLCMPSPPPTEYFHPSTVRLLHWTPVSGPATHSPFRLLLNRLRTIRVCSPRQTYRSLWSITGYVAYTVVEEGET